MDIIIIPMKTISKPDHTPGIRGYDFNIPFRRTQFNPQPKSPTCLIPNPRRRGHCNDGEKTGSGVNWECTPWAFNLPTATSQ